MNYPDYVEKNFALDPYIEVGAINKLIIGYITASVARTSGSNQLVSSRMDNFTGTFTGSIDCATGSVNGFILCDQIVAVEFDLVDDSENQMIDDSENTLIVSST